MAKEKLIKVRVKGNTPLHEDGVTYMPAHTTKDAKGNLLHHKADEFETTPERAASLGTSVEVVSEPAAK